MTNSEKIFLRILKQRCIPYCYQPVTFLLDDNITYTPDFHLPLTDTYIEVVGSVSTYMKNRPKYELLRKTYPNIKFEIRDYLGEPYPPPNGKLLTVNLKKLLKSKPIGVPKDTYDKIRTFAKRKGLSIKNAVALIVEEYEKKRKEVTAMQRRISEYKAEIDEAIRLLKEGRSKRDWNEEFVVYQIFQDSPEAGLRFLENLRKINEK